MKKLIYLIVLIVAFGLIVSGCLPVVPPAEQNELSTPTSRSVIHTVGPSGPPTYDFATIQDAIDAANPAGGDTINVAPGTYGENPVIDKNVTLLGAKHDINPAGSTDRGGESIITGQVMFANTGNGAIFNGFKLSGNRIWIHGAADVTVSYNIVEGSSMHGIFIDTSSPNAQILYNTVSSPAWQGISNQGNSGVKISHNYIAGVDTQQPIESTGHTGANIEITYNVISGCTNTKGINYWGEPGAVISYNRISGTTDEAIFTDTKATIKGNTISNCKDGITLYPYLEDNSGSTVNRNQISNCNYAGISVKDGVKKVFITENRISNSGSTGIELYWSDVATSDEKSVISGNIITNTKYQGITVFGQAFTEIIGNTLIGCNYHGADGTGDWDYAGIHVQDLGGFTSDNCFIDNNTVMDGINGIQVWSSGCTITNNTVTDMGVTFADSKEVSGRGTFYNSGIIIGGMTPIDVEPNDTTVEENTLMGNVVGLRVYYASNEAHFNNIEGNTEYGVFNSSENAFDAINNWWGHASGPGGEGGRKNKTGKIIGKGDAINANVDWDPWLSNPFGLPLTQIVNKWDLEGSFEAHPAYNWGLAEGATWDYSIHIKEATGGEFSVGSINFTSEEIEGIGIIEVTGIVEQTKSNYYYWPESNLAAAGRAEYNDVTYNFLFLYSERAIWFAISQEDLEPYWTQQTVWPGSLREYQLHSAGLDEPMDPKNIH